MGSTPLWSSYYHIVTGGNLALANYFENKFHGHWFNMKKPMSKQEKKKKKPFYFIVNKKLPVYRKVFYIILSNIEDILFSSIPCWHGSYLNSILVVDFSFNFWPHH